MILTVTVSDAYGMELFRQTVDTTDVIPNVADGALTDVERALSVVAPDVCPWDCDHCRDYDEPLEPWDCPGRGHLFISDGSVCLGCGTDRS